MTFDEVVEAAARKIVEYATEEGLKQWPDSEIEHVKAISALIKESFDDANRETPS